MAEEKQTENPTLPPAESTPPYQHPADHSWNLQFLLDIKSSIAKLEERTTRIQQDLFVIQQDIKGLPSLTSYWAGVGLVVTLIIGLAGIYWTAQPQNPKPQPTEKIQAAPQSKQLIAPSTK